MQKPYPSQRSDRPEGDKNTFVILDLRSALYLTDVLFCQVKGGDSSPSVERVEYALRRLMWSIENRGGICPQCEELWHHPECVGPDLPEAQTRFALYRLLDESGRVLYVGVSRNVQARLQAHRRNWGRLFSDVLVEFYPDAASMLEAEAQAIHDEQPPLNADGIG